MEATRNMSSKRIPPRRYRDLCMTGRENQPQPRSSRNKPAYLRNTNGGNQGKILLIMKNSYSLAFFPSVALGFLDLLRFGLGLVVSFFSGGGGSGVVGLSPTTSSNGESGACEMAGNCSARSASTTCISVSSLDGTPPPDAVEAALLFAGSVAMDVVTKPGMALWLLRFFGALGVDIFSLRVAPSS